MKPKFIMTVVLVAAAVCSFWITRVDGKKIIAECIALAASIIFALVPFFRSRLRAGWANAIFITVGIVGVLVAGTELVIALRWIVPARETIRTIHQTKGLLCGFALGLIVALILSQQLIGSKRNSQERHGTAA